MSILSQSIKYHHGNLKAELVSAALALLDEQGIEGVGIRQIARRVGVAHSAPANHFKNKQALFTALATQCFADLNCLLDEQVSPALDLSAAVHGICQCLLNYALTSPHRYSLMWRKDCVDTQNAELDAAMETVYQKLLSVLASHTQAKQVDIESQAIAIWSLIHGYVSLRLDGSLGKGQDDITGSDRSNAIVSVLLEGLL